MDFVLDSNQCNQITNDDTWTVIKKYFEQKGFIRHHLNSYNKFVEHDIQKIISEMYPIIVNSNIYEIKNDDVKNISFHLFEVYKDTAALDFHRNTSYYKNYRSKIVDLLDGPIEVKILNSIDSI